MRHKECWYLLGQPLISGRPPHSEGRVGDSLCPLRYRGVSVSSGTLIYKRHWLASERSVTQQVCEVILGAAGQIRTDSGETSRGADGHTAVCETSLWWLKSTDCQADHFSCELNVLERTSMSDGQVDHC